jgi:hypothetical protein
MCVVPGNEWRKAIYRGGGGRVGAQGGGAAAHVLALLPLNFCVIYFATWLSKEKEEMVDLDGGNDKIVMVSEYGLIM